MRARRKGGRREVTFRELEAVHRKELDKSRANVIRNALNAEPSTISRMLQGLARALRRRADVRADFDARVSGVRVTWQRAPLIEVLAFARWRSTR